jgi:hypothetical protein
MKTGITLLSLCTLIGSANAQGTRFADYWPLDLGYSWTYQNAVAPSDQYVRSVFQSFVFSGNTVLKYGEPDGFFIASNDGIAFSVYGGGDLSGLTDVPDIAVANVQDGDVVQLGPEPILIREWDTLKPLLSPTQLSQYNINPALSGLLVLAWYDPGFGPNPQNAAMEAGLTSGIPSGAITDISWYQTGIGEITGWDVEARNGNLGPRYDLVGHFIDCNGNLVSDELDIAAGTSLDLDGNGIPDECDVPVPPLFADTLEISISQGGTQSFALEAGAAYGSDPYLLLGSFSGTTPGVPVSGVPVPLNLDAYTNFTLLSPNTPPLSGSFGFLSGGGSGTAALTLAAGGSGALVGLTAHHAYVVIDPVTSTVTYASNALPVVFQP